MDKNTKFLDPEQVLFRAGLARGAQVLDLGAGSGFFAQASAKIAGDSGKVYVVDILESALEHVAAAARVSNFRNIQTIRKDLEKDSLDAVPSGSLDLVIMANILHQIHNSKNLFEETFRTLKTSGKVLVIDWNETPSPIGPKSDDRIAENTVRTLAQQGGLHFNNKIETDQYHYGLIFNK
jgi:ubiquinone/menaquinone biosynthesis C-methylase UbiE